ncbi:alpha-galactosidase [Paenibacillus marinisediminis]
MLNNGFAVQIDGRLFTKDDSAYIWGAENTVTVERGAKLTTIQYHCGPSVVTHCCKSFPNSRVLEQWIEVKNASTEPIRVERLDSIHDTIPSGKYTLDYYKCYGNGQEFSPIRACLEGTHIMESTSGRSSYGSHPFFTLEEEGGGILACAFAWSGNWIARFEPAAEGRYVVSGGLNQWNFHKILQPGETVDAVHVMSVYIPNGTKDDVSVEYGRWGITYWYPEPAYDDKLPVVWNHWWPYEDVGINEQTFRDNVDQAEQLGVEVCVVDAGWFGEADEQSKKMNAAFSEEEDWYIKRGDWHKVNSIRFPSGMAALSEYVHDKGMKFGIWCEIEALGAKAELGEQHPEYAARREGQPIGYVCLGNPDAVDWAFGVLEHLILDYKADWIKLDFNLDPKAGCNQTDHGHGAGDGLYEHYRGYYRLLERVRKQYPHVYLENCSSGGYRIDLGIAQHTHGAFLSDPDYTHHHLQLFWSASLMLHPSSIFHFTWSQNRIDRGNNVCMDPIEDDMPMYRFDYMLRANMLNGFGMSYRLPKLPEWALERLKQHIQLYKDKIRTYVANEDMHRLCDQPVREGGGDLWNGYLYTAKDRSDAVLFLFRLQGAEPERRFRLTGLDRDAVYKLTFLDGMEEQVLTGEILMEQGILCSHLPEEGSDIVFVSQVMDPIV